MADITVAQPPARVQEQAYVKSMDEYRAMYEQSLKDPEARERGGEERGGGGG